MPGEPNNDNLFRRCCGNPLQFVEIPEDVDDLLIPLADMKLEDHPLQAVVCSSMVPHVRKLFTSCDNDISIAIFSWYEGNYLIFVRIFDF